MKNLINNRMLKKIIPIILIGLICLPAVWPLLRSGFFTMHDDQQIVRLYELDLALKSGQFPARWAFNLGFGYGYPLFVFYPPFVYYLGELFHLLFGISYILSIKLVFAVAFIGAAYSMYLWTKEHFGKIPAIVAAAFYTYAPYHAVDAYVRGALAELFSFVWLPLIFWSADQAILKGNKKHFIWLGIFFALLMLTHNLIFLPFIVLLSVYLIALILISKNRKFNIISSLFSLLFAFGLSAFFWIPALAEKQYTLVDSILLKELYQYKLHFLEPSQLWNSLWGYGGSTQGPLDGMSFKIGKAHLLDSFLAFLAWVYLQIGKKLKKFKTVPVIFLLMIISLFMTTGYSEIIWKIIKPIQYLQFPWRFLTFIVFFSSFLVASLIKMIEVVFDGVKKSAILFSLLLILLLYPNLKLFKPQHYLQVKDDFYLSDEFIKWKISKTSFEFVPKDIAIKTEWNPIENMEITQVDINREEIATEPYQVISGEGEIQVEKQASGLTVMSVSNQADLKLQLNIFDFPGWEITVDGNPINYDSDNKLKLLTVDLKPSENPRNLKAVFSESLVRKIADLLSLSTLILFLLFFSKIVSHKK